MSKKLRLFSDVTSVSRGERIKLRNRKLLNKRFIDKADTVISWSRLAPFLRDRALSNKEAKQLIVLELEHPESRKDLISRLVSYLSYSEKEQTMKQLEKLLTK